MEQPAPPPTPPEREAQRWRGYARGPRPALTIGLLLVGAALLWHRLRLVDWAALHGVMVGMPRSALVSAAVFTGLSYALYCSFDLLGRRTTGHHLDAGRVLSIGFVSHACALSLGPAGAGARFRLAMRHGLPAHLVAALWLFNVMTNWLGFVVLAGFAFATRMLTWPGTWGVGRVGTQALGVALLVAAAAYVVACRLGRHLSWTVRGVAFRLPPPGVAVVQCLLSSLNWLLIAAVIHALLLGQARYPDVLGAVMASALALAVIDVPAGLGVTETVFLTLLGPQLASTELLAALMAYRAIYFVGPLLLACAVYLALEWDAHDGDSELNDPQWPDARSPQPAQAAPPPPRRPLASGSRRWPP